MEGPRFYRYILRHDDGWAPCTDNNLLSLATCKPAIRRTANVGDYVAGYQPKARGEGLLCWLGRVEKVISHADYSKTYPNRKDANYIFEGSGNWRRRDPDYHPEDHQLRTDVKAPVLIFDPNETWYFGREPNFPPASLDSLRAIGQGHRVRHRLPFDIEEMVAWLRSKWSPGIINPPRDVGPDCASQCTPAARKRKPRAC